MKNKSIYILSLFIIGLTACETDANVDLVYEDPKPAVYCYLDPLANTQYLQVTMSVPVFNQPVQDSDFLFIDDALVKIIHDSVEYIMSYDVSSDSYILPSSILDIEYDQDYEFEIFAKGKKTSSKIRTISSTQIIPYGFKTDTITSVDEFGYITTTYRNYLKWNDPPNELNYYRIFVNPLFSYNGMDTVESETGYLYESVLVNDKDKDGQVMSTYIDFENYTYEGQEDYFVGFKLYFVKLDEHQFNFLKSVKNFAGDDPFSEPALIYTNMFNGLGVIGSNWVYSTKIP